MGNHVVQNGPTDWFSTMSLRTKFGAFAVAIFCCIFVVGIFVFSWLSEIKRSVDLIIVTAKPRSVAAYEMEINLYEAITDVFKYLRSPKVNGAARFEKNVVEFEAHLAQYTSFADGRAEHLVAEAAAEQFRKFVKTGRDIIETKDQEAIEIARLSQSADTLKRIADSILIGARDRAGMDDLTIRLSELRSAMSKIDATLQIILASSSGFHSSTLTQSISVATTNIAQMKSMAIPSTDGEAMTQLFENYEIFTQHFEQFVAHHENANQLVHNIAILREDLDHLLDEEIQSRTRAEVERARDLIYVILDATRNTALSLGFVIAALAVLALVALSRVVVKPIEHMAVAAKDFVNGSHENDLTTQRRDEIGTLGNVLADSARQIQAAQYELAEMNSELARTNRELETELDSKSQIVRSLEDAVERAKVADKAKTAFLTNMSHEFRTPLNGIMGLAEAMEMELHGPLGNTRYKSFSRDIHQSGERLLKLFTDVVEASDVELRPLTLELEPTDIGEVVEAAVSDFKNAAEGKDLNFTCAVLPGLPLVETDRDCVCRAVTNLIDNAVKFAPNGGEVSVLAWHDDVDSLLVKVTDNGDGMSQAEISAALGGFGTINPLQADCDRGLGLGISTSRKLVEMVGGSLVVESTVGTGTSATISLPNHPVRNLDPKNVAATSAGPAQKLCQIS